METILTYPRDRKDELIKVCEDIAEKDESFKWFEREDRIVIVSNSLDTCHKRGMWFIHKFDSRISYKVNE